VLSIVACRMREDKLVHQALSRSRGPGAAPRGRDAGPEPFRKAEGAKPSHLPLDENCPAPPERKAMKGGIFSGQCGGFLADREHGLSDLHYYYAHHKGTKCTKASQRNL
jgi:hypothetical protein